MQAGDFFHATLPGWTRRTNTNTPMKGRTEQHKEEKRSSVALSVALMFFSGGAALVNGNAAYITLNRDSSEYAIVRGTLNNNASWGARSRVSFDYEGEQHELRSAGLLLTKGQLRCIHDELGYIPVCVDRQHPWNAAVCHELTAFGAGCTLLPGLLFLGALVWFLHLIRRKKQSSILTLRKSKRHQY